VIRLVFLSDTHAWHGRIVVPDGDVLVHCGDLTRQGSFEDVIEFSRFLAALPHAHKVVIAGNHDWAFERSPQRAPSATSTRPREPSATAGPCS
jgi:predicted phosphohydrolase